MASKKKKAAKGAAGAVAAAQSAAANPYVSRLIEDEELRDNLRTAYESARNAYGRMANGKGPAKALLDDKKTQKELQYGGQQPEGRCRLAARGQEDPQAQEARHACCC